MRFLVELKLYHRNEVSRSNDEIQATIITHLVAEVQVHAFTTIGLCNFARAANF